MTSTILLDQWDVIILKILVLSLSNCGADNAFDDRSHDSVWNHDWSVFLTHLDSQPLATRGVEQLLDYEL